MIISEIHKLFLTCSSVSIDTRKIEQNAFFFALKGANFDANFFAAEAISKGAKYVVIDNPDFFIPEKTILVQDTLLALQDLATFHRTFLKTKIIALTGSNGKTTSKELIHAVLSKKYNTIATIGNLNNHIGVPLTLLRLTNETEIGIVEMGANHQKEIAFLCEIAKPDYGYITNFGKAHLEGFGGVAGVIKGKSEMYDFLLANEKFVFVNVDDAIQREKTINCNKFTFATVENKVDLYIQSVEANPLVTVAFNQTQINSHLIGIYNATNICAALAIGSFFQVPNFEMKNAIESYIPENNRSQLLSKGTNEIILDAYNANPSSMVAAIENFSHLQHPSKIAILGDMFELGEDSFQEHHKIVALFKDLPEIKVYFIGKEFYQNKLAESNLSFFETNEDFKIFISENQPQDSLLLIKGSRGMALEKIITIL